MIKIVNVVGARPQFIKYFAVLQAIRKFNETYANTFNNILIHTGQHYDYKMSKIFFDELGINEPVYHLGVGSGSHGEQTAQIIQRVEVALKESKPDVVLVYGDTNSTLGTAISAVKLNIKVVHIESGLRSFNKCMAEEVNRILVDQVSTLLFCPSKTAVNNLESEGFKNILDGGKRTKLNNSLQIYNDMICPTDRNKAVVINVGDVMYDVLLRAVNIAQKKSTILQKLKLNSSEFYLLTLHRAETTDNIEKLNNIIAFINDNFIDEKIIFPMHPRIKKVFESYKHKLNFDIKFIEPLGYLDMLMLMKNSKLLMTDSGGMQKEAFWLKKPCITMRDETEWVETVESGWNVLYKDFKSSHIPTDKNLDCYGDGNASDRIVSYIKSYCDKSDL